MSTSSARAAVKNAASRQDGFLMADGAGRGKGAWRMLKLPPRSGRLKLVSVRAIAII